MLSMVRDEFGVWPSSSLVAQVIPQNLWRSAVYVCVRDLGPVA